MTDEYTYAYKNFFKKCFLKKWTIFLVGMWMLVFDSGRND